MTKNINQSVLLLKANFIPYDDIELHCNNSLLASGAQKISLKAHGADKSDFSSENFYFTGIRLK
ncbi:hypothetical protein T11_5773 [Trichinella zimbabwensis]|uniref:Uncharacterized protein n=1 Tax=Trichinella zimbabwensis TaxID=268475 RepID=A0A0V1GUV3_9BILA|nr:hypothetical protein T11_5773 [Trichinella zimbabwensis]